MGKNRFNKQAATSLEGELISQQPEEHSAVQNDESSIVQSTEQQVETAMVAPDVEGEQNPAEEHSTEHDVQPVMPEGETETLPVAPVMVLGIGQFVRQMMLKSTKTNTEILALVHQLFPEAKTTPACIAWYKSDLRKKGLLVASAQRGARSVVQFTPEMLAELIK